MKDPRRNLPEIFALEVAGVRFTVSVSEEDECSRSGETKLLDVPCRKSAVPANPVKPRSDGVPTFSCDNPGILGFQIQKPHSGDFLAAEMVMNPGFDGVKRKIR